MDEIELAQLKYRADSLQLQLAEAKRFGKAREEMIRGAWRDSRDAEEARYEKRIDSMREGIEAMRVQLCAALAENEKLRAELDEARSNSGVDRAEFLVEKIVSTYKLVIERRDDTIASLRAQLKERERETHD